MDLHSPLSWYSCPGVCQSALKYSADMTGPDTQAVSKSKPGPLALGRVQGSSDPLICLLSCCYQYL